MVFEITGIFGPPTRKRRPLLNQIPVNITRNAGGYVSTMLTQKRELWTWFRGRPELNSPVQIRVDDTITEVDFFAPDSTPLGRNKRMSAQKFWETNQVNERLKSVQYDRLVTGSGFIWLGFNTVEQVEQAVKEAFSNCWFRDVNMKEVAESVVAKAIDEDLRIPRKIDYVASSTMQIEHNLHEVLRYIQWYGGQTVEFSPEEIIHMPLVRADGKVDGWTPVSSLVFEMALLVSIKENMLAWFVNGGSASNMFILPDELANSENHLYLQQELRDKGVLQNRHGNYVFTGNVKVEKLEVSPRDMEYKDLALYVTSNIAYALRVPVSRIPYLIGKAQDGGDSGGLSESGYWSMIESDQRIIEDTLNQQLFRKLGFTVRFKKRYKIDDLREAQAMNFRVDAVTKMQAELKNAGKRLADSKLRSLLDLSANDVVDAPKEEIDTGLLNRSNMPDRMVNEEQGQIHKDQVKRTASINNPKGSNQTGF